ncbi:MAG: class I SAM-dependent rRNA methyltransferase [Prevotellaceae bacterium]|jgi:23S rRNA (cytosine1962-C5)-methyltransferase|nr:class I SAM-dependent rRNA methyltransferase [Prevotellaceae bacterium]
MVKIILKQGKEEAVKRFHPWIFSGAIKNIQGEPQEGDVVEVYTVDGKYAATGHYQIGSIAVRILSFIQEKIDDNFWFNKLSEAYKLRQQLGLVNNAETTAYRLVHGEGDGLPGLIIDIYGAMAVFQAHSAGMYLERERISECLKKIYGSRLVAVYDKSAATVPFKAGLNAHDNYLYGSPTGNKILEYGNGFIINWKEGQKTGFFLDQRENRRLLEQYCKNALVLNMFCYTGGFSVYALQGGAKLVHSVDSSAKAVDLTRQNVALNFGTEVAHEAFVTDAFEFMHNACNEYNVIILDPPAFAKHTQALHNALQAYKRINTQALTRIQAGGILFTFSCSQVVSREYFRQAVFSAAAISERNVRILHQLTQPADHPISIYHPEGEYLKGLILYVE